VRLALAEYGEIRADPHRFFVSPGHEQAEAPVGTVVARESGYVLVEKDKDIDEE
jgi:hypothetical protein